MKELVRKIIKNNIALALSLIALYGIGYAQQTYRSTILDDCFSRSNIISIGYNFENTSKANPDILSNSQQRSNLCSNNCIADFSTENACCETERCDNYSQTTDLSLSIVQDSYLPKKNAASIDAGICTQNTSGTYGILKPLKVVPIYILTQSIIC